MALLPIVHRGSINHYLLILPNIDAFVAVYHFKNINIILHTLLILPFDGFSYIFFVLSNMAIPYTV